MRHSIGTGKIQGHDAIIVSDLPPGMRVELRWKSEIGTVHFLQLRDHGESFGIDQRGDIIDQLQKVAPPPAPNLARAIETGDVWSMTEGTTEVRYFVYVDNIRLHNDCEPSMETYWSKWGEPGTVVPRTMWRSEFERLPGQLVGNIRRGLVRG